MEEKNTTILLKYFIYKTAKNRDINPVENDFLITYHFLFH